jgi:hypothetical protein
VKLEDENADFNLDGSAGNVQIQVEGHEIKLLPLWNAGSNNSQPSHEAAMGTTKYNEFSSFTIIIFIRKS